MVKEKELILYVDDDIKSLETFKLNFENMYNVLTFSDPIIALKEISNYNEIPIIIADQKMPDLPGIKFLEKTIESFPNSIRILLTAYSDKEFLFDAINTGKVYNYVLKPWNKREISNILNKALDSYNLFKKNQILVKKLKKKIKIIKKAKRKINQNQKKVLVANIATEIYHEIKNQLGTLSLLELFDISSKEEMSSIIKYIFDARDRIINIIDEMRSLSKNEKSNYIKENYSIKDLLYEISIILKMDPDLKEKNIIWNNELDSNIEINKTKIIQVIINIIKNSSYAIKKKANGYISINTEIDKNYFCLKIIDNGIGIDEDNINKIWKPFYSTKGNHGTGIGLYICKRIIEGHNGEIICNSILNKGSTFTIKLPII